MSEHVRTATPPRSARAVAGQPRDTSSRVGFPIFRAATRRPLRVRFPLGTPIPRAIPDRLHHSDAGLSGAVEEGLCVVAVFGVERVAECEADPDRVVEGLVA